MPADITCWVIEREDDVAARLIARSLGLEVHSLMRKPVFALA